MVVLKFLYGPSSLSLSLLADSCILGTVAGQLVFGVLADKIGRKKSAVLCSIILICGAIGSALLSWDIGPVHLIVFLIIWRAILGFGIGGEYPVSASMVAEQANEGNYHNQPSSPVDPSSSSSSASASPAVVSSSNSSSTVIAPSRISMAIEDEPEIFSLRTALAAASGATIPDLSEPQEFDFDLINDDSSSDDPDAPSSKSFDVLPSSPDQAHTADAVAVVVEQTNTTSSTVNEPVRVPRKRRDRRGFMVAAMFSAQGIGNLAAPVVMVVLLFILGEDRLPWIWRLSLLAGAVPALLVLYPRIRMHESHSFQKHAAPASSSTTANVEASSNDEVSITIDAPKPVPSKKATIEIEMDMIRTSTPPPPPVPTTLTPSSSVESTVVSTTAEEPAPVPKSSSGLSMGLFFRHYGLDLLGTAGSWFLFDVVFYGNGLFTATLISMMGFAQDPNATEYQKLMDICLYNLVICCIALPGYWFGTLTIDFLGRKTLQLAGFFLMGILYCGIGYFFDDLDDRPIIFIVLYGCTYFVSNAGPNTTTFVVPSETFPTRIRSRCHGLSAAFGKVGALVGGFAMSPVLEHFGVSTTLVICGLISFVGLVITFFFVHETKNYNMNALDERLAKILSDEDKRKQALSSHPVSPV